MDRGIVGPVTENFQTTKILVQVSKHETRKMCNITSGHVYTPYFFISINNTTLYMS